MNWNLFVFVFCVDLMSAQKPDVQSFGTTTSTSTRPNVAGQTDSPTNRNDFSYKPVYFPKRVKFLIVDATETKQVKAFDLAFTWQFNCTSLYLPINFETQIKGDNKNIILLAYLNEIESQIETTQAIDQQCRKIKRYKVDDDTSIIVVNETFLYLQNNDIHKAIAYHLWNQSLYNTYFHYKFGTYDERTDSIKVVKFISYSLLYLFCIGLALLALYAFYRIRKEFKQFKEVYHAMKEMREKNISVKNDTDSKEVGKNSDEKPTNGGFRTRFRKKHGE